MLRLLLHPLLQSHFRLNISRMMSLSRSPEVQAVKTSALTRYRRTGYCSSPQSKYIIQDCFQIKSCVYQIQGVWCLNGLSSTHTEHVSPACYKLPKNNANYPPKEVHSPVRSPSSPWHVTDGTHSLIGCMNLLWYGTCSTAPYVEQDTAACELPILPER